MSKAISSEVSDLTKHGVNKAIIPIDTDALTDLDSDKLFIARITKDGVGIDKFTLVASNFEGTDGATTDLSDDPNQYPISFVDTSKISTDQFKTGSSSGFINGVDANAPSITYNIPVGKGPVFSGNAITVECWLRPNDIADDGVGLAWLDFGGTDNLDIVADMSSGGFIVYTEKGEAAENKWTIPHAWVVDTWIHYRMTMIGTTVTFAITGLGKTVSVVDDTNPDIIFNGVKLDTITLGHASDTPTVNSYRGYMDGFRVSDTGRDAVTTFTPQTSIFERETLTKIFVPVNGFIYNSNDQITKPLISAFSARVGSSVLTVTGDGTNYTIIADTEVFDQNADYNTGTGVYTAPVAANGYCFNGAVEFSRVSDGVTHTDLIMLLVTTNFTFQLFNLGSDNIRNVNAIQLSFCLQNVEMGAGHTAFIRVVIAGATKIVGVIGGVSPITYFMGHLEY